MTSSMIENYAQWLRSRGVAVRSIDHFLLWIMHHARAAVRAMAEHVQFPDPAIRIDSDEAF